MSLDQQGYLWLSDPWMAALMIVVAVGLLLWCHQSLSSDESQQSVAMPARTRRAHRTAGSTRASGRDVICPVAVKRERRDANRRRVA